MKNTIIAQNKEHLQELIKNEIQKHGNDCNLNHIDTSLITDMSFLFFQSYFNGDISAWNVSSVESMTHMFNGSIFNCDLSMWNTSKVQNMSCMFARSRFNGDIGEWNTVNVRDMYQMFSQSDFNNDISNWNVENVKNSEMMFFDSVFNQDLSNWSFCSAISISYIFSNCSAPVPYWAKISNFDDRVKAIEIYQCKKQLEQMMKNNEVLKAVLKI